MSTPSRETLARRAMANADRCIESVRAYDDILDALRAAELNDGEYRDGRSTVYTDTVDSEITRLLVARRDCQGGVDQFRAEARAWRGAAG